MKTLKTLEKLLISLKDKTDWNDHNGAVLELAEFLDSKDYIAIMKHVIAIADIESGTPHDLQEYRSVILKLLFDEAGDIFTDEEMQQIKRCF